MSVKISCSMSPLLSRYGRIYSITTENSTCNLNTNLCKATKKWTTLSLGSGKQGHLGRRSLMAGNLNFDIRNCHRAKIGVFRSSGHDGAHLNPVWSPILVESVVEQIHVDVLHVVLYTLSCRCTETVFRAFYSLFRIYIFVCLYM
jgi:hypothetical protein